VGVGQEWLDFKVVRAAVTIEMVLDRYGVVLKKTGQEMHGPCPIHKRSKNQTLTAHIRKNVFGCSFKGCRARGNIFDFVAAIERCQAVNAAIKLSRWFKVGGTDRSRGVLKKQLPECSASGH
jgi:DNA primase